MELTTENVDAIMAECLVDAGGQIVKGVIHSFAFDPDRIKARRDDIKSMLSALPLPFFKGIEGGGGGWSFLMACDRRDGVQWTGFHLKMEALFALGIAAGFVTELTAFPRDMLPGGMPYYVIDGGA